MNRILAILVLAAIVLGSGETKAQPNSDVKITITEFGPFHATLRQEIDEDGTYSGRVHDVTEIIFTGNSEKILAKIGTSFGIRYLISGPTSVELFPVTTKVFHPQYGVGGDSITQEEWVDEAPAELPRLAGFQFDHDYELAEGAWRIELWIGGVKYAEQQFLVSK